MRSCFLNIGLSVFMHWILLITSSSLLVFSPCSCLLLPSSLPPSPFLSTPPASPGTRRYAIRITPLASLGTSSQVHSSPRVRVLMSILGSSSDGSCLAFQQGHGTKNINVSTTQSKHLVVRRRSYNTPKRTEMERNEVKVQDARRRRRIRGVSGWPAENIDRPLGSQLFACRVESIAPPMDRPTAHSHLVPPARAARLDRACTFLAVVSQ
ncbi:hypothetical protein BDW22DRAFT_1192482 [Trametopsis cervina]|nr:hypothetical protein BDW22DRAFT_1192482 [Trametopsis cervina]